MSQKESDCTQHTWNRTKDLLDTNTFPFYVSPFEDFDSAGNCSHHLCTRLTDNNDSMVTIEFSTVVDELE